MKYKINGVEMPAATVFEPDADDLDGENSARGEDGVMNRDRIRAGVSNIKVEHEMLTRGELDQIITAATPVSFSVEYLDSSGRVTKSAYASKFKKKLVFYEDDSTDGSWWNLSFTIVQN